MNQIPNIEEEDIVDTLLEDVAVCLTTAKNCVTGSEKNFDFDYWREKLNTTLLSQAKNFRQDWLRSEIEKLEGVKTNYVQGMENGLLHHREPCQCQTCVDKRNDTLTSIITRYKEELLELDKTSGL